MSSSLSNHARTRRKPFRLRNRLSPLLPCLQRPRSCGCSRFDRGITTGPSPGSGTGWAVSSSQARFIFIFIFIFIGIPVSGLLPLHNRVRPCYGLWDRPPEGLNFRAVLASAATRWRWCSLSPQDFLVACDLFCSALRCHPGDLDRCTDEAEHRPRIRVGRCLCRASISRLGMPFTAERRSRLRMVCRFPNRDGKAHRRQPFSATESTTSIIAGLPIRKNCRDVQVVPARPDHIALGLSHSVQMDQKQAACGVVLTCSNPLQWAYIGHVDAPRAVQVLISRGLWVADRP